MTNESFEIVGHVDVPKFDITVLAGADDDVVLFHEEYLRNRTLVSLKLADSSFGDHIPNSDVRVLCSRRKIIVIGMSS